MRWRTAAQTSPSSWGEAILLCSTEIISNPFKWKGFLSALVITRYTARVWWRRGRYRGGKRRRKHDRQVLKFNGWGRKEVERGMCWNRENKGGLEGGTPKRSSLRLGLRKDMFMVWGLGPFFDPQQQSYTKCQGHICSWAMLLPWWGDLCGDH